MEAWFRWIKEIWLAFFATTRRLLVFPDGAVPVTLTGTAGAWGAWAGAGDQIAATVGTKPVRIYQIDMSNPSAVADFEVQIGYGVALAEVWLGPITGNSPSVTLPFPLEVPAGERLAARCRDSVGASTIDVKMLGYTIE